MTKDLKLAKKHGVTPRTVRNWRLKGAPVDDPKKLRVWLASRRSVPPKDALPRQRKTVLPPPGPVPDDVKIGATAALHRLELAEAAAFSALQSALASGDPGAVRFCRDGWLRTSEGLRKQDLAIAADRRDSGELITRTEALRCIVGAWSLTGFGLDRALTGACDKLVGLDLAGMRTALDRVKAEVVLSVLVCIREWPWSGSQLPPWITTAITEATSANLIPTSPAKLEEILGIRSRAFLAVMDAIGGLREVAR